MKKLILLASCFVLLSINSSVFSQNKIPSLGKLMSWSKMSYAAFDLEARNLGFSFLEKKVLEGNIKYYSYTRKVKMSGFIHTETLAYTQLEKAPLIAFCTSRIDLITFYTPALKSNHFTSMECPERSNDSETAFCHETTNYFVQLVDGKCNLGGGDDKCYTVYCQKK